MNVFPSTRHPAASSAADDAGFQITFSEVQGVQPVKTPAVTSSCALESAELFQATFALNPLPMWVYDGTTLKFLEVNQAATEQYGYCREEFLQMTLLDIRPDEEKALLLSHLKDPQAGAEKTWVHLKKNGERMEVQVHGQHLQFQGRPARLSVILDVTEKNRIQRALEESQAHFRLIAENTVNLIMQFDQKFHASYVSPSIQTILGYTQQEFLEIPDYSYIHPEDWPMVEQEVMRAIEQQAEQHILEYRIQHKDGHHLWCETAFRLIWEDGVCQGFVSSSLNISDRVAARQELMASLTTSTQLVTLAEELEEASDPADVIQLALKHCTSVIPFDYGMFVRVHNHQYQVDTCLNLSTEEGEQLLGQYLSAAGPRLLHAFLKGTPAFFGADEAMCEPAEVMPRQGAFQVAVLPVSADGHIQGFLALGTRTNHLEFTGNARRILRAVRDRISHAFERNTYIEKLSTSREETLKAIGMVLEYRDYETKGHTDRVVQLSDLLGRALGITGDELDALRWGAYLHDTGKIAIPDHILLKPGRLTPEEFEQVKKHSEIGFEMLKNIPSLPRATLDVILHHHERWDGNGYPAKMGGYSIPMAARIFTVVDVYDALISRRPYKEPFTHEAAMEEIQRCAGSMFDPAVVQVFSEVMAHEMLRQPTEQVTQPETRSA